jgi:hypothetical protein
MPSNEVYVAMKTRDQGRASNEGRPIPFRKFKKKVNPFRPSSDVLTSKSNFLAPVVPLFADLVDVPSTCGVKEAANKQEEKRELLQKHNTLLESWLEAYTPIPVKPCLWHPNLSEKEKDKYRKKTEQSRQSRVITGRHPPPLPPDWNSDSCRYSTAQMLEKGKSGWWGGRPPTVDELFTFSRKMAEIYQGQYVEDDETLEYRDANAGLELKISLYNNCVAVADAGPHFSLADKGMTLDEYDAKKTYILDVVESHLDGCIELELNKFTVSRARDYPLAPVALAGVTRKTGAVFTHFQETFESQRKKSKRALSKSMQYPIPYSGINADSLEEELKEQFRILEEREAAVSKGYASPISNDKKEVIRDITVSGSRLLLWKDQNGQYHGEVSSEKKRTDSATPVLYWQKRHKRYRRWLVKNQNSEGYPPWRTSEKPSFFDLPESKADKKPRSARAWMITNKYSHRSAGWSNYEAWWMFKVHESETDRLNYKLARMAPGIGPLSQKSVVKRMVRGLQEAKSNLFKQAIALDSAFAEGIESGLTQADKTFLNWIRPFIEEERVIDSKDPVIPRVPEEREVVKKLLKNSQQRLLDKSVEQSYLPLKKGFKKLGNNLVVPNYKPLDKRPPIDIRKGA